MRSIIGTFLYFLLISSSLAEPKDSTSILSWRDTQIDIAARVHDDFSFYNSVILFRGFGQFLIDKNRYIKVTGDTTDDISQYDVVHILGDLNDTVYLKDQAELVIRKNFTKEAKVYASGIQKVYVGGDFLGTIESTGLLNLIVKGDFKGTLTTGHPSTYVLVEKSFDGVIKPTISEDGGLISVQIKGNTLLKYIDPICTANYTSVKISVDSIDAEKGIHICKDRRNMLVVEN